MDKKLIAERLRELRMEKEMSYQTLAHATGISKSALCRWENAQADITLAHAIILAKFFDVSIEYLAGLEDYR